MKQMKAITLAAALAAICWAGGHWGTTARSEAVAARTEAERWAVPTAGAAIVEGHRRGAIRLAQATRSRGYDPMAGPVNPMIPGGSDRKTAEPGIALNPEFGNLPDTPGMQDTFHLCTACHSAAIIKQQRISDARWDYLWNWMVEHQGMPEQDPATKETILSYLKRHFSSER